MHFQLSLDGSNKIEYKLSEKKKEIGIDLKKIKRTIKHVIDKNKNLVHRQKTLQDVTRSPISFVFNAEELWKEGNLNDEKIKRGLWQPFPLHNLCNKKMALLIDDMNKGLGRKQRVIVPKELLGLAVLNYVDNYLSKKTTSHYIKTRNIKDLSAGRRSYASRMLKDLGYIEEHGSCWRRTDKIFNEKDFWPGQ